MPLMSFFGCYLQELCYWFAEQSAESSVLRSLVAWRCLEPKQGLQGSI